MSTTESNVWPFHIFYKDHLAALLRGDPCLGVIKAGTEQEAIAQASAQGLGQGADIVAAHIPSRGVAYRDNRSGRVKAVFPYSPSCARWYPFGYFDDPGKGELDPEIVRAALALRIERMEKVVEQYPDWRPYREKLQAAQDLLELYEQQKALKSKGEQLMKPKTTGGSRWQA